VNPFPKEAIITSSEQRKLRGAIRFVFASRAKFGRKFDFSEMEYVNSATKISIKCPKHGIFFQSPSQHLRGACGCTFCGAEKTKLSNSINTKEYKKCNECNTTMPIDRFRTWNSSNRGIRIESYCIDCKRNKDRIRARDRDKKKLNQAKRKYNAKQRIKRIEETNPKSEIYIRRCDDCGCFDVLKYTPKGLGLNYCKRHQSRYRLLGKTFVVKEKEVECVVCGATYIGKQVNCMCSSCAKKRNKERKKNQKRKRRALIRGASKGIAFSYKDIFKRDNWKCKLCGCNVQKKDIYADNAAELDHIIPVAKGGTDIPSNLQTLCFDCNRGKGVKIM